MDILEVNDVSVSEAEKRLKKLERDYQHDYKKYIEIRSNWFWLDIKANYSNYHSVQAGICIRYYQVLQEKLQNTLEKLNRAEETPRGIERLPYHFDYCKSRIPKNSNSKAIHKLLRSVKDAEKLIDEAIASGYHPTSRDSLTTRIEMEIKLLTKVIKKLKKESERETMTEDDNEEKKRELKKKCECMCKWDEEQRNFFGLKQTQWFLTDAERSNMIIYLGYSEHFSTTTF